MRKRYTYDEIVAILERDFAYSYESHNGRFNRFFVEVDGNERLFAKNNSRESTYIICNEFEEDYNA